MSMHFTNELLPFNANAFNFGHLNHGELHQIIATI